MKPRAASLLVVLALSACGSAGGGASSVVNATARALSRLRAGDLHLLATVTPTGARGGAPVGFALDGPFAIPATGGLPRLDVRYTRLAGTARSTAEIRSNGRSATVVTGGRAVALAPAQLRTLRFAPGESASSLGIHPASWITDASARPGPRLDGQATDEVSGRLDATAALRDLEHAAGGALGPIRGVDPRQIAGLVRSSSITLLAGHQDHLLRRLSVDATIAMPSALAARLSAAAGLRVRIDLRIARPRTA